MAKRVAEINYEIKPEHWDEVTVEQLEELDNFYGAINYCIAEGFIEAEEDEDGEVRLYPART